MFRTPSPPSTTRRRLGLAGAAACLAAVVAAPGAHAATVSITRSDTDQNVVTITAGGAANDVFVAGPFCGDTLFGRRCSLIVTDAVGMTASTGCVRETDTRARCDFPVPNRNPWISADLGGGDDRIVLDPAPGDGQRFHADVDGQGGHDDLRLVGSDFGGNTDAHGSDGEDTIEGFDDAEGGVGRDTLRFNVVMDGDGDADTITCSSANRCWVNGGPGNDTITGAGRDDVLRGDAGVDVVLGEGGHDELHGGDQGDVLDGGPGDDVVRGNADSDTLRGQDGDDDLFGDAGDDNISYLRGGGTLTLAPTPESADGGTGIDTISYSNAQGPIQVSFDGVVNDGSTARPTDVLVGFEHAEGGARDDVLRGDDAINRLIGGPGDDDLRGFGGDDVLIGGAGSDALRGSAGADTIEAEDGLHDVVSCGTSSHEEQTSFRRPDGTFVSTTIIVPDEDVARADGLDTAVDGSAISDCEQLS